MAKAFSGGVARQQAEQEREEQLRFHQQCDIWSTGPGKGQRNSRGGERGRERRGARGEGRRGEGATDAGGEARGKEDSLREMAAGLCEGAPCVESKRMHAPPRVTMLKAVCSWPRLRTRITTCYAYQS